MKHFVLIVGFASGKKVAFATNSGELDNAIKEFRAAQAKSLHYVLEDKSFDYPVITSVELIRMLYSVE